MTLLDILHVVGDEFGRAVFKPTNSGTVDVLKCDDPSSPLDSLDTPNLWKNAWVIDESVDVPSVRRISGYSDRTITLSAPMEVTDNTIIGVYFGRPPFRYGVFEGITDHVNSVLANSWTRVRVPIADADPSRLMAEAIEADGVDVVLLPKPINGVFDATGFTGTIVVRGYAPFPLLMKLTDVTTCPFQLVTLGTIYRLNKTLKIKDNLTSSLKSYRAARSTYLPRASVLLSPVEVV